MAAGVPTISPLAIAYIKANGPQTAYTLSKVLPYARSSIFRALSKDADAGALSVERRLVKKGTSVFWFGIPATEQPREYPRIGAGCYVPRRPTGSRIERIERIAACNS